MLKRIFKVLMGIVIFLGICLAIFFVILRILWGRDYSTDELVENFAKKRTEIYNLQRYYLQIIPKNRHVEIEFKNDHTLERLVILSLDSSLNQSNFMDWDLETSTPRIDSVIRSLNWDQQTLKALKKKLDDAHCVGIASGEPCRVSFQRSGMGMYFFNVFSNPIPDSLYSHYNDSCSYILVNKTLVLEYGGGGFGNQCFYNISRH